MDSDPDSLTSEAMLFLLLHSGFEQPSVKKWAAVIYTPNYTHTNNLFICHHLLCWEGCLSS